MKLRIWERDENIKSDTINEKNYKKWTRKIKKSNRLLMCLSVKWRLINNHDRSVVQVQKVIYFFISE